MAGWQKNGGSRMARRSPDRRRSSGKTGLDKAPRAKVPGETEHGLLNAMGKVRDLLVSCTDPSLCVRSKIHAWLCRSGPLSSSIMATQELFAQVARLPTEERRFLAEIIWETVDADLPAQWENDATISAEVERRFEAFKAGREKGLSHDEVFAAAKALAA